jgi:hypothetical protein
MAAERAQRERVTTLPPPPFFSRLPQPAPISTYRSPVRTTPRAVPSRPRTPLVVRPLAPATRAQALARAAQTVRYLERPVLLEGRPATLATYITWSQSRPRTFSFVRQNRRTDQARIVRVDEKMHLVTVLVPARGAVVQTKVPVDAIVAYSQALNVDPPSPALVARADELLGAGPAPVVAAVPQPVERVSGMRELLGRVIRVDAAARLVTLEGVEAKTPFRVPEGVDLPAVGDLVTLTTAPDTGTFPPVASSVTPLQPTVEGVLTRVQPTSVELNVRTVTPEGRTSDVPVPVNEDARVYLDGKPADLRALKEGLFIRAFITPTGEVRILGYPRLPDR